MFDFAAIKDLFKTAPNKAFNSYAYCICKPSQVLEVSVEKELKEKIEENNCKWH